jgi:hypothetical protein
MVHEVSATARMGANPNGSWVKVSDYDAAIRRAEEAEKALAKLQEARDLSDKASATMRDESIAKNARIADLEAKLAEAEAERDALRNSFKCFQCGEVFTDFIAARNHFGFDPRDVPVCRVDGGTAATIYRLRRNIADYQLREETEGAEWQLQRAALQGDHARALRRAEEEGYAKGLGDFTAERTRREALEARIRDYDALVADRDRWQEDSMRQAATINRLAAAAEDRNEVDAKRRELHEADLRALTAERTRREALEAALRSMPCGCITNGRSTIPPQPDDFTHTIQCARCAALSSGKTDGAK